MNATETLYKLPFAANLLKVHPRTLERWGKQGKITLVMLPSGDLRISGTELQRIMGARPADTEQDADAA
ncbi:MAG: hypothetical protein WC651_03295 [Candidatus Gracilibacteria bacterium]|jgi:putative resolvase